MYRTNSNPLASIASFRIEGRIMRYSVFMPKLYNLCKSLGFQAGKIMPSRAFCADESQGYPVILIAKHFCAFPFNHGMVGGVVATDRHGPHAEHGKDLVIIQASHVGYNPETRSYGVYKRMQTDDCTLSSSCGKVDSVLSWYDAEHRFARENILISRNDGNWTITIDNQLLDETRDEGLFLHLDRLVTPDANGILNPVRAFSTSRCFLASPELSQHLDQHAQASATRPIGDRLLPHWCYFLRTIEGDEEGRGHLEQNLLTVMPWILASRSPLLVAAKVNTQVEFDRTYRSILRAPGYRGARVFFISGLNIDISPTDERLFPLTKFIPWAAYLQHADGENRILEQDDLFEKLEAQSAENPDQIDLENAIRLMSDAREVAIPGE
ncbi:MAG: hypothetical protein LJE91_05080 [Gammaproteobacteria bacterium]|jgi:hypothetical protein|nr:hypothetical protein [Gammaproteobacteria bacterium]